MSTRTPTRPMGSWNTSSGCCGSARASGLPTRIAEGHPHSDRIVARLEGIEDRDRAAALTGAVIEVDRAELPPTGEREYYQADLIGLPVRNLEGVELGKVDYFVESPTGPMMIVKGEREYWIPAVPQHLSKVDLAAGLILVDWPAEPLG